MQTFEKYLIFRIEKLQNQHGFVGELKLETERDKRISIEASIYTYKLMLDEFRRVS